jgi:hypothetical protein
MREISRNMLALLNDPNINISDDYPSLINAVLENRGNMYTGETQARLIFSLLTGRYYGKGAIELLTNIDKWDHWEVFNYIAITTTSPQIKQSVLHFRYKKLLATIMMLFRSASGDIRTAEKEFTINQQQYLRSASLSNAYTGFGFDYAFSLAKSLYLIPGISGGWGTMEVNTTQYAKGVETSNSTIGGSPNDVNVFNHSLRNNYFMVNPGLSVEFAPALLGSDKPRIITVRAHAGYALSFMGDWKENGKTIVNNVSSGIEASGLAFQLGFMIGLFN